MSSEKLCLKGNDFQTNISDSFSEFRTDSDFCDFTLTSEGNQQIKTHKVILAASSSVLMEMIRSTKHTHPLIYMRGIKASDLAAIVDFMYFGEAKIFQEDIDGFLGLAEELKLRGLTREESPGIENNQGFQQEMKVSKTKPLQIAKNETPKYVEPFQSYQVDEPRELVTAANLESYIIEDYADFDNLNEKLESMIERIDGYWNCKVCRTTKIRNHKTDYRRHAETHLEGVSHPCNICGKLFRSSKAHRKHVKIHS